MANAQGVPHAVEVPDRVPKERYYDPAFFDLENFLVVTSITPARRQAPGSYCG